MIYTPDTWVVFKVKTPTDEFEKVLAGWSGSYMYGQSYKINSSIVRTEVNEDHYDFHGHSGSVYRCYFDSYGFNYITRDVWETLIESNTDEMTVELVESYNLQNR